MGVFIFKLLAKTKNGSISLINTIEQYAAADNNVGEDDFSEDKH